MLFVTNVRSGARLHVLPRPARTLVPRCRRPRLLVCFGGMVRGDGIEGQHNQHSQTYSNTMWLGHLGAEATEPPASRGVGAAPPCPTVRWEQWASTQPALVAATASLTTRAFHLCHSLLRCGWLVDEHAREARSTPTPP